MTRSTPLSAALLLFATLTTLACSGGDTSQGGAVEAPPVRVGELTSASLTLSSLGGGAEVTLVDGAAEDQQGRWRAVLMPAYEAIGDFDDDGIDETAVLFDTFDAEIGASIVIVAFEGGSDGPVPDGEKRLGAGVDVYAFEAVGDTLDVVVVQPGPGGESRRTRQSYRKVNGRLQMTKEVTLDVVPSEGETGEIAGDSATALPGSARGRAEASF